MNTDLFLSILAMDSYNRNYGQGILLNTGDSASNQNEAGRQLGNAVILNVDIPNGSVNAGFYAIAYNVSNVAGFSPGQTVISYRGGSGDPVPGHGSGDTTVPGTHTRFRGHHQVPGTQY